MPKFYNLNLIVGEGETDRARYWDILLGLFKNVSVMKKKRGNVLDRRKLK